MMLTHYNTMAIEDIAALPVKDIAADDSVLFLWVTFPHLQSCFKVIEDWGFKYTTIGFNWFKTYPKNKDKFFVGLGNWTRANSELCLMAKRGHPQRVDNCVESIIKSPIGRHSEKPQCVKKHIVELLGDVPRIELFARTSTPGWSAWGNEVTTRGLTELTLDNFV